MNQVGFRDLPTEIHEKGRTLSIKRGRCYTPETIMIRDKQDAEVVVIACGRTLQEIKQMLTISLKIIEDMENG